MQLSQQCSNKTATPLVAREEINTNASVENVLICHEDHVISCTSHCKTPMSNSIRNETHEFLQESCKVVKMTSNKTMLDKEPKGLVTPLPNMRPFDISINFNHMLNKTAWRVPLKRLGFDMTRVTSRPNPSLSQPQEACCHELQLRLRKREKVSPPARATQTKTARSHSPVMKLLETSSKMT